MIPDLSKLERRTGAPRGEDHVNAKLTEENVRHLRDLHGHGYGFRRLGGAFRISAAHAARIVKRQSWAHVQ